MKEQHEYVPRSTLPLEGYNFVYRKLKPHRLEPVYLMFHKRIVAVDHDGDHYSTDLITVFCKPSGDHSIPPELPPPPLTGVAAEDVPNATNSIRVSWDPSTAPNAAGYRIYRSLTTFNYLDDSLLIHVIDDINASTVLIDDSVENNITYFYGVSAYSATGLENKNDFTLVWAVSIYDIKGKDDEPKEPVNITKEDDPLYETSTGIADDVISKINWDLDALGQYESPAGPGFTDDDGGALIDPYYDDSFGYDDDPDLTIIEIEASPSPEEPDKNDTIDDNTNITDDDEPPVDDNEEPPTPGEGPSGDSASISSATMAVLIAWLVVLIITVITSIIYIRERKREKVESRFENDDEELEE